MHYFLSIILPNLFLISIDLLVINLIKFLRYFAVPIVVVCCLMYQKMKFSITIVMVHSWSSW